MRILFMPLYGIGDVLMTTPAIRNIKERLPESHLTCLHMFKTTRDILAGNPHVDENIHYPFMEKGRLRGARFLLALRGKHDVSVNPYPSNRRDYSLAAFLAGCTRRIGHRYRGRDLRGLNFLKNLTVIEDDGLHNVEENLRLLQFLGIESPHPYRLEIYLSEAEEAAAAGWLKERGLEGNALIGFHPGTSSFKGHTNRRWPAHKFSALIDELHAAFPGCAFLLFGGPEESPLKNRIKEACGARAKVYEANLPGIRQTAAVMKAMRLFVTNDSGLMHISAALQVPTVAIFGPTEPRWVAPWMCPSMVVRLGYECSPCFRYSPAPLKCIKGGDFPCLEKIEVIDVLGAAKSLFSPKN